MRYSVWYNAALYYGEEEGKWNHYDTDNFTDAVETYNYAMQYDIEVEIHDNEYDVVFKNGEWS